jgi:hypothetical protein
MTFADKEDPSPNERPADEVEFIIIDSLAGSRDERPGGRRNTGALIDLDSIGTGMLTHVPLHPGTWSGSARETRLMSLPEGTSLMSPLRSRFIKKTTLGF